MIDFQRLPCLGVCLILASLLGCSASPPRPDGVLRGVLLEYAVIEAGEEAGRVRILAAPGWLRVDGSVSSGPYWVMAGEEGLVYRVEEGRARRVSLPSWQDVPPFPWEVSREPSLILLSGSRGAAEHQRFRQAGRVCLNVVLMSRIPSWLQENLMEARLLMAEVPWQGGGDPPCREALARDPLVGFRDGLPLRLWDGEGNGWFLIEHRQGVQFSPAIFSLNFK